MAVARQEGDPAPGRARQKNRTRRALVAAAGELLRAGVRPTIPEVAEAAEVSRATAYRYFPTQELLVAEVALFSAGGPLVPEEDDASLPAPERVARLVRRVAEWAYDNQQALRALLSVSLDPAGEIRRPGHRIGWIADALAPVRGGLDPETYEKLAAALALHLGIDPVVVMTDIAGIPRDEAIAALEWSARTLVEAALAEARDPARP